MRTTNQEMADALQSLGYHECENAYCEGSVQNTLSEMQIWQGMIDNPPHWLKPHLENMQWIEEQLKPKSQENIEEDEVAQAIPTTRQLRRIRYSHSELISLKPRENNSIQKDSENCAPKQRML